MFIQSGKRFLRKPGTVCKGFESLGLRFVKVPSAVFNWPKQVMRPFQTQKAGKQTPAFKYEELESHTVKSSDAGQSEEWDHFCNHILLIL